MQQYLKTVLLYGASASPTEADKTCGSELFCIPFCRTWAETTSGVLSWVAHRGASSSHPQNMHMLVCMFNIPRAKFLYVGGLKKEKMWLLSDRSIFVQLITSKIQALNKLGSKS